MRIAAHRLRFQALFAQTVRLLDRETAEPGDSERRHGKRLVGYRGRAWVVHKDTNRNGGMS